MSDFSTHYITAHKFFEGKEFSNQFKTAYYFGVQGPDLFFYLTPIKGGDGMAFGGKVHQAPPKEFFEHNISNLNTQSDFYKGYFYGFLMHYFGDINMHPYIGHLCRNNTDKYAHIMYERDIDALLYKDVFDKPISTFDIKGLYEITDDLVTTITAFWRERIDNGIISEHNVRKCMNNIVNFSNAFVKVNKKLIKPLTHIEKNKGSLTGHFKITDNPSVMNYDNIEWKAPNGVRNLSVHDIIENTLIMYNIEYDKINKALTENTDYTFTHDLPYDFGC